MLGDGIVSFGVPRATDLRNAKSSAKMRRLQLQLAGHTHRCRRELDVAVLVVELNFQIVLRLGDPADLIDEVHVPRGAAVFAVGHALEPDVLLHLDDLADGRVLDAALVGRADPSGARNRPGPGEHLWVRKRLPTWSALKGGTIVHAETTRLEGLSFRFNHKFGVHGTRISSPCMQSDDRVSGSGRS